MENMKLTSLSKAAGCGAKIGPEILSQALKGLPKFSSPNLLVGAETSDDAAVYKLNNEMALIQTLDFFTPIDDDPYYYGLIAATNALSDIYAMGGKPIVALNIVAFPCELDIGILSEILKGGADKVKEAGAVLVGGHSIKDSEPKYGLSVTGIINPNKVLKNFGAQTGDVILLTKPLGTGLISTALKFSEISKEDIELARASMTTLNNKAAEIFAKYEIHACTDVTGFGLAGHLNEMATAGNNEIHIVHKNLKILGSALDYARGGMIPAGTSHNKKFVSENLTISDNVPQEYQDLIFDPQTSGGLAVAVNPGDVESIISEFDKIGKKDYISQVGYVADGKPGIVIE